MADDISNTVSVIIPCFNGEEFLAECIYSALAQTPYEIIVVDDGSKDRSVEIASAIPGVTVIAQANQRVAAARNAGLARATGEYVVFLDADDIILPNGLVAGASALDADPRRAMVYGGVEIIDAHGKIMHLSDQPIRTLTPLSIFMGAHPIPTQTMLRRAAVVAAGGFRSDLPFNEDQELWLRLLAAGGTIYCHGARVAGYRRHGTQSTHEVMRTYRSWLSLAEEMRDKVPADQIGPADWRRIDHFIRRTAGRYLPFQIVRLLLRRDFTKAAAVSLFYGSTMPHSVFGTMDMVRERIKRRD